MYYVHAKLGSVAKDIWARTWARTQYFLRCRITLVVCLYPAYRATLLPIRWAQVKTALTFLFITV
jgi:hypothetical protein